MRLFVLLVGLLTLPLAGAAVYKIVNEDGSITYSDRPEQGAEEVNVAPLQTFESQPIPDSATKPETPDFAGYESFEVVKPQKDETLRDNGGVVSISLALTPGLFREHTVSIYMDGKELGSGRSTSITLRNVDRGSHTVQGVVVDKDGKTVEKTLPVTFHLHKTSKLSP